MVKTWLAVYAGWDKYPYIGPDEMDRYREAIEILRKLKKAILVVTSGVPKRGTTPHSNALKKYVLEWGIPNHRVIENPAGTDTVTDTIAILEAIKRKSGPVIVVTSWYHIPRVWIIWTALRIFFDFGRKVSFRATGGVTRPIFSLLCEIFAIPKSIAEMVWMRKTIRAVM